jgi:hypothetical protein
METSIAIGTNGFPVIAHDVVDVSSFQRVTYCVDRRCSAEAFATNSNRFGSGPSLVIPADGVPFVAWTATYDHVLLGRPPIH